MRVYVAGPMRGYPIWNFHAFDHARDLLLSLEWDVISPADIDREAWGGDPLTDLEILQKAEKEVNNWTKKDLVEVVRRDVAAMLTCDAIALLPGWEYSTGAVAEFFIACWLGLIVLDATTGRAYERMPDVRALMNVVVDYLDEVEYVPNLSNR